MFWVVQRDRAADQTPLREEVIIARLHFCRVPVRSELRNLVLGTFVGQPDWLGADPCKHARLAIRQVEHRAVGNDLPRVVCDLLRGQHALEIFACS